MGEAFPGDAAVEEVEDDATMLAEAVAGRRGEDLSLSSGFWEENFWGDDTDGPPPNVGPGALLGLADERGDALVTGWCALRCGDPTGLALELEPMLLALLNPEGAPPATIGLTTAPKIGACRVVEPRVTGGLGGGRAGRFTGEDSGERGRGERPGDRSGCWTGAREPIGGFSGSERRTWLARGGGCTRGEVPLAFGDVPEARPRT